MPGFVIAAVVLACLALAFVLWGVGAYNGLVALRNRVSNAFSQIDVQLKRRHDLIPNLVETAKGYMSHERETLEAVMQARSAALRTTAAPASVVEAGAVQAIAAAESQLTGAIGRLLAVAEAYPNLKADASMQSLMEELTSTENKVSFARQAFNDSVLRYNTQLQTFPTLIIGGLFNFRPSAPFEITNAQEREAPRVTF